MVIVSELVELAVIGGAVNIVVAWIGRRSARREHRKITADVGKVAESTNGALAKLLELTRQDGYHDGFRHGREAVRREEFGGEGDERS